MVGRIYHVGLTVSDLERSIAFYRDVLGIEFQPIMFKGRLRLLNKRQRLLLRPQKKLPL